MIASRLSTRPGALAALVSTLLVTGCAGEEDRPPPTPDEVVAACGEWNLASCRKLGECLGWTAAEVQDCINEENAGCAMEVEGPSCLENQRDAYERCAADIADDVCTSVCNERGFCFLPCSYGCPSS